MGMGRKATHLCESRVHTYESEFCSWAQLKMVDGSSMRVCYVDIFCYTMIIVRQRAILSPYDLVK